jgi:hypothetical protein
VIASFPDGAEQDVIAVGAAKKLVITWTAKMRRWRLSIEPVGSAVVGVICRQWASIDWEAVVPPAVKRLLTKHLC